MPSNHDSHMHSSEDLGGGPSLGDGNTDSMRAETDNNSLMSARELLSKRQLNCWSYLLPNREISVQVI